jgi:hypothetical protein
VGGGHLGKKMMTVRPLSSNTLWRRRGEDTMEGLGDGGGSRKGLMFQRQVTRVDPLRRGKRSETKRREISRYRGS